jgi:hypothetical protein
MQKTTALCTDKKELGWIITMKGDLPHLTTAIFSIVMTRKKKNIAVKKRATAKKMRTSRKMTAKRKAKTKNRKPAKMERTTIPGKR